MSRLLDAPEADRNRWSSNWSFILASVGSAIGFGNIWRFPKLCYEFGGGAFLIPYLAALFFFTIPVVVLEFALVQNFQVGHVRMMSLAAAQVDSRGRPTSSSGSSAPAGLGWAAVLGTYLLSQFYMALLAITLCYVVASFSGELPWSDGRAHAFFLATTSPSAGVEESGHARRGRLVAAAAGGEGGEGTGRGVPHRHPGAWRGGRAGAERRGGGRPRGARLDAPRRQLGGREGGRTGRRGA